VDKDGKCKPALIPDILSTFFGSLAAKKFGNHGNFP
jgi:hypothetical protein